MSSTLFVEMSAPRRIWETVGGALLTGAVSGFLVEFSPLLYLLAVMLSFAAGVRSATQHRSAVGATLRGAVAGACWALALIVVVSVVVSTPTVPFPDPIVLLIPIPALVGALTNYLYWLWIARRTTPAANIDNTASTGS